MTDGRSLARMRVKRWRRKSINILEEGLFETCQPRLQTFAQCSMGPDCKQIISGTHLLFINLLIHSLTDTD